LTLDAKIIVSASVSVWSSIQPSEFPRVNGNIWATGRLWENTAAAFNGWLRTWKHPNLRFAFPTFPELLLLTVLAEGK